jgi:starch synthase
MSDFTQVGGLGEVSAALPRALRLGADVRVLIPGYPKVLACGLPIEVVGRLPEFCNIPACDVGFLHTADGLPVYVLICPALYERDGTPYVGRDGRDWADNHIRFARLSLAAAEFARGSADPIWRPDLLHLNDWPTALAPAYLAWSEVRTPTVLTIHNLAYQGLFEAERGGELGVPGDAFDVNGVEFHGRLSFLKAGLFYASHLTTVSPTYAEEITTTRLGCGLDGLLRTRAEEGRLSGILNGLDESWDPRVDERLAGRFDVNEWEGKQANADYVRQLFELPASSGPLFAIVSRLVQQKGVDLAIAAAETVRRQHP